MSGTPMSNEQRAALEQRLAQLRAAQAASATAATNGGPGSNAAAPAHQQASQPQQQQQQAPQQRQQYPPPRMGYGYADDDDDDEEDDEDEDEFDIGRQQFEDEFLSMLAAQQQQQQQQRSAYAGSGGGGAQPSSRFGHGMLDRNAASVAQVNATRHADDGVDVVATDKTAQRSRELGDFEALRLAKMGDTASMLDFGAACGVNWRTFTDNHGRNALHYAADAGAAGLIRKLTDELRVPYVADEKKMTPLDIAVLNGHDKVDADEVVAALVVAAAAARHADAAMADGSVTKTLESVLLAHAPAPPKFVMSKPVPKPEEARGARTFWSATAAPAAAGAASVQCSSGSALSAAEAEQAAAAVTALDRHGRLEWLLPVTRASRAACEHWQIASSTTPNSSATCTGVVVAQVLANARLTGPAAQKMKQAAATAAVVVAAHLGVHSSVKKSGVAASLLHALRGSLQAAAGGDAVVFFAAGAPLPRPPAPLATVKWYRRVFDVTNVFASDSAYDVFPDFYTYDTVLRADAVLKGALPSALEATYAAQLPSWCDVDAASEEQCALLRDFVAAKAGTAESNTDLACVPGDVAELRRSYLAHPDHRAYVRTDAQGNLTDVVVFRRRDARKDAAAAASTGTFAAEVVYALFTSLSGTAKVDHMMLLAAKLLSAAMLLVPTMFGLTESDLAKSNMDEMVASRESVYAVSPATLREVDGLGPVPASRLSLPLYTI